MKFRLLNANLDAHAGQTMTDSARWEQFKKEAKYFLSAFRERGTLKTSIVIDSNGIKDDWGSPLDIETLVPEDKLEALKTYKKEESRYLGEIAKLTDDITTIERSISDLKKISLPQLEEVTTRLTNCIVIKRKVLEVKKRGWAELALDLRLDLEDYL